MKEKKVITIIVALLIMNMCVLMIIYRRELKELLSYIPGINQLLEVFDEPDKKDIKGLDIGDEDHGDSLVIPFKELDGNHDNASNKKQETEKETEKKPDDPPKINEDSEEWGLLF